MINQLKNILFIFLLLLFTAVSTAQVCEDSIQSYSLSAPGYITGGIANCKLSNGYGTQLFAPADLHYLESLIGLTDKNGAPLRTKKLSLSTGLEFHINRFTEAPTSGLVGYGFTFAAGNFDYQKSIVVIRFDSSLNVLWSKEIRPNFTSWPTNLYLQAIHCDHDGTVFLSFELLNSGGNPRQRFFVALNSDGSLKWSNAITGYYGPDFHFHINAATTVENKVLFLAASSNDTTINFKKINRPGYTGFSFDKATGQLIRSDKAYIPYLQPFFGYSSGGINNDQLELFPTNGYFSYAFGENHFIPTVIDDFNLISFVLDTTFTPHSLKKLKGKIAGRKTAYSFNKNSGLALLDITVPRATNFAALDSSGNILISKNIGTGIFSTPAIIKIDFTNDDHISLWVNNNTVTTNQVQVNIPLHSKLSDQSCLGKDTSFFTIESVNMVKETLPVTVYADVVNTQDLGLQISDYSFQKQELCKVKSVCNSIQLVGDSSFCTGDEFTFVAKKNAACMKEINWSVDTSYITVLLKTDSSVVLKFTKAWQGYLKAGLYGCTLSDSILINVHQPQTTFSLGQGRHLCMGDSLIITASDGYKNYLWNTGNTSVAVKIYSEGEYSLKAEDYCGNQFNDIIKVITPKTGLTAIKTQTICLNDFAVLEVSKAFKNYNWMPAETTTQINESIFSFSPKTSTLYQVTASDQYGCQWSQSFTVNVEQCPEDVWFPNAFSPNNDGLNDVYKPAVLARLINYQFRIYNRWGEIVFQSKEISKSWDGKLNGKEVPQGVYIWTCQYQFKNRTPKTLKGSLTLLR